MPIDQSFDPVLHAARTGAEWARAMLYEDPAPSVLGYLRARGAAEPEDLTVEVFLQVVRDPRLPWVREPPRPAARPGCGPEALVIRGARCRVTDV